MDIQSFACGEWIGSGDGARDIANAVTGQVFARAGNTSLDYEAMIGFGKERGGKALRALTFHDRARMLKALALHLNANKQKLYDLSFATGATQSDNMVDVDGGIGTLFVYASKGRRELPGAKVLLDGDIEQFGKKGLFLGQHIYTPRQGVAVHINAFNFPVWGMLEKLAPSLLAGVPSIVKPATVSCYVTEACVRLIIDSGILPDGALQLVTGGLGNTLDLLTCQDAVTFTGSANTAMLLRTNRIIISNGVRFTAEQDSLNASILGPDAKPGTPEFDLFVKEVSREMTVKSGQKCTAIRRVIAPDVLVQPLIEALSARLAKTIVGDPQAEGVRMGPLVSLEQKADVLAKAEILSSEAEQVWGNDDFAPIGEGIENGAFVSPMLFHCGDPDNAVKVHEIEAFGPVSTVMGYRDVAHAVELANKGQGSLVASVITRDPNVACEIALGSAAFHGRLYFNNRDSMAESTGHGSPMPHMVHGGPGRAGGGEELGGIRGVKHFMQRTAIQGSPDILTAIGGKWVSGAAQSTKDSHPFTHRFGELDLGESLRTEPRQISLEDIEHFATFTGDKFYAHMDQAAAERNPFFPGRVAHGYLLLSFAAGLFVEPNEGPVLANTGLDNLRFLKPVEPGQSITATLTVKQKTPRNAEYGEVRWDVQLTNEEDEIVAEYELLTMVAM
ncbi:MAG: phenylacetic acid degradation bifunctional protein PaaZ [Rhizobiales bacterium]|nr:phenylacetic acid degradation bifunctional protein PaaZ [Hyphomicrobiales bacterium]